MAENQLLRFKHPAALLLLVTILAIFAPLWNSDLFYLHDDLQVAAGTSVTNGKPASSGVFVSNFQPGFYFRPLSSLSHLVDQEFGGSPAVTAHIINIVVHAVTCYVLYYLLLALSIPVELAFWGVLIFGLHPIHTNAVGWISGRSDLLAGFFTAITLLLFISYLRSKNIFPLAVAAVSILCGILCKEHIILLPFLLFVFIGTRMKVRENFNQIMISAVILSVPLLLYALLRLSIASAIRQPAFSFSGGIRNFHQITEPLGRFIFPSHIYNLPLADSQQALVGSAAIIALTVAGFLLYKKKGIFTFLIGAIWYLMFSLPGLFAAGTTYNTACYWDCRAYVPLIGLLFPLATALELFYERISAMATPVLMSVVIGFCFLCIVKGTDYYSGEDFWKSVIKDNPAQPIGYVGLFNYSVHAAKPRLADTIGVHVYETFPGRMDLLQAMADTLEHNRKFKLAERLLLKAEPEINDDKMYTQLLRNIILAGDFNLLTDYSQGKYFSKDLVIKNLKEQAIMYLKAGRLEQQQYLLLGKRLLEIDPLNNL